MCCNSVSGKMGRSRGLEPPTLGTTNRCSNQLSYDRHGANGSGSLAPRAALRGHACRTQGTALRTSAHKSLIDAGYKITELSLAPLVKEAHRSRAWGEGRMASRRPKSA